MTEFKKKHEVIKIRLLIFSHFDLFSIIKSKQRAPETLPQARQGQINYGALGAHARGPPTLKVPPQERSCFENNESKLLLLLPKSNIINQYYCFQKQIFLYEAAMCRTTGVMKHQSLYPAANTMTTYLMFSSFTASQSHENVRHNFDKLLFVNRYDGNVNFTHGLGAPTRMSAPWAPQV